MTLEYFDYKHLPEPLQPVSAGFYDLAHKIVAICPDVPQRALALQKLLEAKDCAVRAALPKK